MDQKYIKVLSLVRLTKVDNVIIDFSFLFRGMLRALWRQQENIFGKDMSGGYHTTYKVFLLNNYYMCVDTCLRAIAITKKLIAHLNNKFEIGKFYIILSDEFRIPHWRYVCPDKKHKVYTNRYELCIECKQRLMDYSKYIPDGEIEEYLPYEDILLEMSGVGSYVQLRNKDTLYTYDKHEMTIAKNKFFHLMQILQSELTPNEWMFIYEMVREQIVDTLVEQYKDKVTVFCNGKSLIKGYEAAELAVALSIDRNETSLLITKLYIPNDQVFIMDIYEDKYHRTTDKKTLSKAHNIPTFEAYVKPRKRKTLDTLFDLCNNDFHDKLITTNAYNIYNVFKSPLTLYIKNKRPKELEDIGRTYGNIPLDKSMVIDIMHEFIPEYNKLFGTHVRVI